MAAARGAKDGADLVASRLHQVVGRASQLPCVLVGTDGRIAALSASAAKLLGSRRDDLKGERVRTIAGAAWRSEPMRLLQGGTIDTFSARSSVRRADGRLLPVSLWARLVDSSDGRWIVLAFTPEGAVQGPSLVQPLTDGPTVIGFGTGDGSIAMISEDARDLVGFEPDHLRNYPSSGFIHADDLPDYLLTISTVVATGRSHHLRVRVRHADGRWIPVEAIAASLPNGDQYRIGFVLRAVAPPADHERVEQLAELEDRLRKIAVELAAIGVAEHVDPEVARLLGELSARQQEVVRLLQDGARVPTIAQELFLSQSTVRNHLSAIFRKFGVASQEELLRAMRR
ncbi:MAG: Response regulator containing a CheY-like receiver domain and an DNA-binding domain [Actinomycetia bacterium]|nr:Response regulator containing a CheY-like receiver domain and an DNA-binding domain [Actinomycetes bacterium]